MSLPHLLSLKLFLFPSRSDNVRNSSKVACWAETGEPKIHVANHGRSCFHPC